MNNLTINMRMVDHHFTQWMFPAGETHIRLTPEGVDAVKRAEEITILARITNATEIMNLLLLRNAILPYHAKQIKLVLPYLPYGRADRRFAEGDCFALEVFCGLVSPFFVVTLDAHSRGFAENVSPLPFIRKAIVETAGEHDSVTVLYPDKGARERYQLPTTVGNNHRQIAIHVVHANKNRDAKTGAMLDFDVPSDLPDAPILVVDDICDGGATFIGIGKALGNIAANLYVTHGIFSKGFASLLEYYPRIFTTNSFYQTGNQRFLTVFDCAPELLASESLVRT